MGIRLATPTSSATSRNEPSQNNVVLERMGYERVSLYDDQLACVLGKLDGTHGAGMRDRKRDPDDA